MIETRRNKRAEPSTPSPSPSPPASPTSSATSPAPLRPLKRISTDVGPPPATAQESLRHIRRALADRTSYRGLLLLNIPLTADKAVRRMVATQTDQPTFKLRVEGPYPDQTDIDDALNLLNEDVAEGATLYISIRGAKPETENFRLGVQQMAEALGEARPDVKLVFAACGGVSSLKSEGALPDLEVRDIRSVPWDFTAEAHRLRTTRLLHAAQYDVPPARASLLLLGLTATSAQQAVKQAQILGKRRRDAGESCTNDQSLADLADAVESLQARSGKKPKKDSAVDLSYIQQFMRRDLEQAGVTTAIAGLPLPVKQFVLTLKRSAAMRGVVPSVKRTMLLKGPPGTGKTTVARALGAQLGYPVLAPKSSAFVNEYIGQSAANVYRFFAQARAYADLRGTPVVIFFDEIDALLKKRSGEAQSGEREYDRIVNAFLESLEGIDGGTDDRLIIIGATNFSGTLDNAGFDRFSVKAELGLPDVSVLQEIYQLHLAGRAHSLTDAQMADAARLSTGLSGRHVVNILDKAGAIAFEAAGDKPAVIAAAHVREAVRVISSETETSYIQAFLKQPGAAVAVDDVVANVPKEVGRFTRMLEHFHTLKRVVPDANKSMLLWGDSGTGKTSVARAIADQMQMPIIAPNIGALLGKYHGESAENVQRLFAQARVYARAHDTQAVILLDDIDALLSDRSEGGSEHRALVAAFLENMRGTDAQQNERLIFIGTTRAAAELDPGVRDRFHLRVRLECPRGADMRRVFNMHLKNREHTLTQPQLQNMVGLARGFSGRNIVEAINRAGYIAREATAPGAEPSIDEAALRAGIIEEMRQVEKDGSGPPPPHMYA